MKLNLQNKYDILLSNEEVKNLSLKDILWKNKTILYFYPKDNTPWCTVEFYSIKIWIWNFRL